MSLFTLRLPSSPSGARVVSVTEEGELPEYGQVWVWDMVYAQVMHGLAGLSEAQILKETLDVWAVNMSSKIYQPFDHVRSKGHTRIDSDLEIGEGQDGAVLRVQVSGGAQEMPSVTLDWPGRVSAGMRADAVIALAQYFIDINDLFAKELPLHVLAFRKYYSDVREPEEPESVEEAPLYAIQKALEYFNSVASGTTPQ